MERRSLISKLILGTVQFGIDYGVNNVEGKMSDNEINQVLTFAHGSNLTTLDTAAAYGDSELKIGKYLLKIGEKNFDIITKISTKNELTAVASLENSLRNLRVESLDTLMFHNFVDFKLTNENDLLTLRALRGSKYKKLGISLYTNEEINEVLNYDIFDVIQVPFNALDNHKQRGLQLKRAKDNNIEIHTRSVFLQGLFFMEKEIIPLKLKPLVKYLDQLVSIAIEYNLNMSELALNYALSKSYIDKVLIGVDSINHLKNNLQSIKKEVPPEALHAVDNIVVLETGLLNPSTWKN